jgi:hypothetical protein
VNQTWTESLWAQGSATYQAILEHPFLLGLTSTSHFERICQGSCATQVATNQGRRQRSRAHARSSARAGRRRCSRARSKAGRRA